MEGESHINIHLGTTQEGEPNVVISDNEDNVLVETVGEGEMTRGRAYGEEIIPGQRIVLAGAFTKEGVRKLDEELRAEGAKRVGGDSPDIGRTTTHGWTRKFGDRYGSIFGHEESKN